MATMNPALRAFAVLVLDKKQKEFCSEKGMLYEGPYCEQGFYKKIDRNGFACKGDLCIDHIDNNNSNNPKDGSNWQYLCRGHNGRKNHRGATKKNKLFQFNTLKDSLKRVRDLKGVNDRGDEVTDVVIRFAEMDKNKRASPLFREFVSMTIDQCGVLSKKDLLDAGAEYVTQVLGDGCGIDQQTAERYLKKLCAPIVGKFEIYNAAKADESKQWFVRRRGGDDGEYLPTEEKQ